MANEIDKGEVIAAWGTHYKKNRRQINQIALKGDVSSRYMTRVPNVIENSENLELEVGEATQAFDDEGGINKGEFKLKHYTIGMHTIMIKKRIYPEREEVLWQGHLEENQIPRNSYKFMQWIQDELFKKVLDEKERLQIGQGEHLSPKTDPNRKAENAMDGFLTVMGDHVAHDRMKPLQLTPWTPDNLNDYLATMVRQIPVEYDYDTRTMGYCFMSPELAQQFRDNALQEGVVQYVQQAPSNANAPMPQVPNGRAYIRGTFTEVIGLPSMRGSNRVFITTRDNFHYIYNKTSGVQMLPAQANGWAIDLLGRYQFGVGFKFPQLVITHDIQLAAPELLAPTTLQATSAKLAWKQRRGSKIYTLRVARDESFSDLVVDNQQIAAYDVNGNNTTSQVITNLEADKNYYWELSATQHQLQGEKSRGQFKTAAA